MHWIQGNVWGQIQIMLISKMGKGIFSNHDKEFGIICNSTGQLQS